MSINWNPSYSVGVESIDKQHQQFFTIINSLYETIASGNLQKDVLNTVFTQLSDYAKFHFQNEEIIFEKIGYPDSKSHILEHQTFVRRISEIRRDFENDDIKLTFELTNYMEDWLVNHINSVDKKYTDYFNLHGIK